MTDRLPQERGNVNSVIGNIVAQLKEQEHRNRTQNRPDHPLSKAEPPKPPPALYADCQAPKAPALRRWYPPLDILPFLHQRPESIPPKMLRYHTCGLAHKNTYCACSSHPEQKPFIKTSVLACGYPHICYRCSQWEQDRLHKSRTLAIRQAIGPKATLIQVRLNLEAVPHPDLLKENLAAYQRNLLTALDTLEILAKKASTFDWPGMAVLGAVSKKADGVMVVQPAVTLILAPEIAQEMLTAAHTLDATKSALLIKLAAEAASEAVGSCVKMLTCLPRTINQKVLQADTLHKRRLVRRFCGLPTKPTGMSIGGAKPQCPVCKDATNPENFEHRLMLPSGNELPASGRITNLDSTIIDRILSDVHTSSPKRAGPTP